jgi:hypothetical protein
MRDEFVNETLFLHIEDARCKIAAPFAAIATTDLYACSPRCHSANDPLKCTDAAAGKA